MMVFKKIMMDFKNIIKLKVSFIKKIIKTNNSKTILNIIIIIIVIIMMMNKMNKVVNIYYIKK
jgi:hypothetical protein